VIRPLAEFSAHLTDTANLIGASSPAEDVVFTGVAIKMLKQEISS
jgi:hypothetical protein